MDLYINSPENAEHVGWAIVPDYCFGDPDSTHVLHDTDKGTFTYISPEKTPPTLKFTLTRQAAEILLDALYLTVPIGGGSQRFTLYRGLLQQLSNQGVGKVETGQHLYAMNKQVLESQMEFYQENGDSHHAQCLADVLDQMKKAQP